MQRKSYCQNNSLRKKSYYYRWRVIARIISNVVIHTHFGLIICEINVLKTLLQNRKFVTFPFTKIKILECISTEDNLDHISYFIHKFRILILKCQCIVYMHFINQSDICSHQKVFIHLYHWKGIHIPWNLFQHPC